MASVGPVCITEGGISRQVLTVLGMMNVVEGFTMNVIWPFLPFMVEAFGVATEDTVGLYVGILGKLFARTNPSHQDRMRLESLYAFAWCAGASYYLAATCSAIVWGILADKLGRRPTLLAGTLGTCAANLVFGFAPSYKAAVFGRYKHPFLLSMLLSTCCVNVSVLTASCLVATQQRTAPHCKSRESVFLLAMQGA